MGRMTKSWISVKDKLPPCTSKVLVCSPDQSPFTAFYIAGNEGGEKWLCRDRDVANITHWQPLPDAPDGS